MLGKTHKVCHKTGAVSVLAALVLVCPLRIASAQTSDRFCIVPVKNGAPTEKDLNAAWRLSGEVFLIPGLPGPVFTPLNRGGQWTINAERTLVPYQEVFPRGFLDRFLIEPWSGRVVAVGYGTGVSVLRPDTGRFAAIENDDRHSGQISLGPFLLPRKKLTVVVSGKGLPKVVEDRSLRAWMSEEEMTAHGIRGIYSIHDAPSVSATVIVDLDRNIHVVSDDGQWQTIGSIGKNDYAHLIESPAAGVVLLVAQKSVVAIRRSGSTPDARFSAEVLATTNSNGAGLPFPESRLFGQILNYSGDGQAGSAMRWRRFGPDGKLEEIPGGQLGLPRPDLIKHGRIQDLPTIGRTLIEATEGFFLYDGSTIRPVVDGGRDRLGDLPRVYDLPSIKRVLVVTRSGWFELRPEGNMVAVSMPFPVEGLPVPDIADWPESGVALVSTQAGVFSLEANLNAKPVAGGDQIGLGWLRFSNGTNPATGEMIMTGRGGLFLAVDSHRSRDDICRHRQQLERKIPR